MLRYLIMVVTISVSALGAVRFMHDNPDTLDTVAVIAKDRIEAEKAKRGVQSIQASKATLSGTERLRADRRGHYVAEFKLNRHRVKAVVDTGATLIALNRSEARRAGVHVAHKDFIYPVSTANGTTRAARVIVDEVRIGSIRVRNVEAMILEDDALDIVLIGMSFLNRLRNFEFSNGVLEMKL
ncbi:retropepsin-like aspartic protease family protein [Oricola sp.]|uniref:retropepsin-like aspartic protease family protein n=1 Tax=Oricola sp. TaxID=1979950 RepID=UPI003BA8E233